MITTLEELIDELQGLRVQHGGKANVYNLEAAAVLRLWVRAPGSVVGKGVQIEIPGG